MNKSNKEEAKAQYIAKRKSLIELSKFARLLIEQGAAEGVNDGLTTIYKNNDNNINEFNTFNQWRQKGYTIIKGSKAFLVWGQPRNVTQVPEGSKEPEEYKFWPVCYLFSDTQVFKKEVEEIKEEGKEVINEPSKVLELDECF